MAQLLFEKFDVPGLYLHPSSVLSLYSVGHTTGMVLDAGASATRVVPVYEGCGLESQGCPMQVPLNSHDAHAPTPPAPPDTKLRQHQRHCRSAGAILRTTLSAC